MHKSFIVLLFSLFLASHFVVSQEITPMKRVIHAHDLAMDKMPTIVHLVSQLQPKADTTETGQLHVAAIKELKASNKAMMLWMQNFGERFTADEMLKDSPLSEKKQQWLVEERKKIKALNKKIDASISKANKLLLK